MWDSKKSVLLSLICTRFVIAFAVAAGIALPIFVREGFFAWSVFHINDALVEKLMPLYYAAFVPGFIALLHLNSLLVSIRGGQVFIAKNVKNLRVISWCCYAAAAIFAVGTGGSIALIFIAATAAFAGLILRVIKNVLEAGVELKDENDFTI